MMVIAKEKKSHYVDNKYNGFLNVLRQKTPPPPTKKQGRCTWDSCLKNKVYEEGMSYEILLPWGTFLIENQEEK